MNSYFPGPADHVPVELIRDFDIFELPPGIEDPLLKWGELLEPGTPPIIYTPRNGGHWIFLDYEDIREAYRNDDLFSNYQTPIPPLEPYPVMQPQGVDPPEHKKFRSLLAPLFTPIAVKRMEEELRRRSATLIEGFVQTGSCDFVREFSSVLPTGMFLYLMGMPEDRLPEFHQLSDVFMRSNDEAVRAENINQIYAVIGDYLDYRAGHLGEDLGSVLLKARDEHGKPFERIDILNCGFLLFVAGLDTVTSTMTYIWRYLALTPEARRALCGMLDERPKLVGACEELLRINAVSNIYRRVKQDMSFRGIRMKRNDRVVLPNNIANRNASVFANPTVIDLEREVNTHLTFGAGPHRCIGSHLAKAEIMIALQEWLRRIPDFSLQPGVAIEAYLGPVMGMRNLPLVWSLE